MRLLLLLCLLPGLAFAQDDGVPPPPLDDAVQDSEEETAEDAPVEVDAFTARLLALVDRYYAGIGAAPASSERDRALESIRTMLLDGVALPRVHAAVDDAIRLHTPGRSIAFHIAVPLRVKPAGDEPSYTPPPPPARSPARPVDPEVEGERSERRRRASARRTRQRLYRQWQSRTRTKRALLAIGVPLWAAGYSLGFGLGGLTVLQGSVTHEQAWLRAIPIAGQFIYFGSVITEGAIAPDALLLGSMEVAGAALLIAALVVKADWPYERDPTALRIRGPDGRTLAALSPMATPTFLGLTGRF